MLLATPSMFTEILLVVKYGESLLLSASETLNMLLLLRYCNCCPPRGVQFSWSSISTLLLFVFSRRYLFEGDEGTSGRHFLVFRRLSSAILPIVSCKGTNLGVVLLFASGTSAGGGHGIRKSSDDDSVGTSNEEDADVEKPLKLVPLQSR